MMQPPPGSTPTPEELTQRLMQVLRIRPQLPPNGLPPVGTGAGVGAGADLSESDSQRLLELEVKTYRTPQEQQEYERLLALLGQAPPPAPGSAGTNPAAQVAGAVGGAVQGAAGAVAGALQRPPGSAAPYEAAQGRSGMTAPAGGVPYSTAMPPLAAGTPIDQPQQPQRTDEQIIAAWKAHQPLTPQEEQRVHQLPVMSRPGPEGTGRLELNVTDKDGTPALLTPSKDPSGTQSHIDPKTGHVWFISNDGTVKDGGILPGYTPDPAQTTKVEGGILYTLNPDGSIKSTRILPHVTKLPNGAEVVLDPDNPDPEQRMREISPGKATGTYANLKYDGGVMYGQRTSDGEWERAPDDLQPPKQPHPRESVRDPKTGATYLIDPTVPGGDPKLLFEGQDPTELKQGSDGKWYSVNQRTLAATPISGMPTSRPAPIEYDGKLFDRQVYDETGQFKEIEGAPSKPPATVQTPGGIRAWTQNPETNQWELTDIKGLPKNLRWRDGLYGSYGYDTESGALVAKMELPPEERRRSKPIEIAGRLFDADIWDKEGRLQEIPGQPAPKVQAPQMLPGGAIWMPGGQRTRILRYNENTTGAPYTVDEYEGRNYLGRVAQGSPQQVAAYVDQNTLIPDKGAWYGYEKAQQYQPQQPDYSDYYEGMQSNNWMGEQPGPEEGFYGGMGYGDNSYGDFGYGQDVGVGQDYPERRDARGDDKDAISGPYDALGTGQTGGPAVMTVPPIAPQDVVGTGHRWLDPVSMEGQHKAIDIQAYQGTPALAPIDGHVVDVAYDPRGLGLQVSVQGSDGKVHKLSHLLQSNVQIGDKVRAGQPIAKVGSTGAGSTGPHLDYRVMAPDGQTYYNPEPLVGWMAQLPRADKPTGAGQERAALVNRGTEDEPDWELVPVGEEPPDLSAHPQGPGTNDFSQGRWQTMPEEPLSLTIDEQGRPTWGPAPTYNDDVDMSPRNTWWPRDYRNIELSRPSGRGQDVGAGQDWTNPDTGEMWSFTGGDPNDVNAWNFEGIDPGFTAQPLPGNDLNWLGDTTTDTGNYTDPGTQGNYNWSNYDPTWSGGGSFYYNPPAPTPSPTAPSTTPPPSTQQQQPPPPATSSPGMLPGVINNGGADFIRQNAGASDRVGGGVPTGGSYGIPRSSTSGGGGGGGGGGSSSDYLAQQWAIAQQNHQEAVDRLNFERQVHGDSLDFQRQQQQIDQDWHMQQIQFQYADLSQRGDNQTAQLMQQYQIHMDDNQLQRDTADMQNRVAIERNQIDRQQLDWNHADALARLALDTQTQGDSIAIQRQKMQLDTDYNQARLALETRQTDLQDEQIKANVDITRQKMQMDWETHQDDQVYRQQDMALRQWQTQQSVAVENARVGIQAQQAAVDAMRAANEASYQQGQLGLGTAQLDWQRQYQSASLELDKQKTASDVYFKQIQAEAEKARIGIEQDRLDLDQQLGLSNIAYQQGQLALGQNQLEWQKQYQTGQLGISQEQVEIQRGQLQAQLDQNEKNYQLGLQKIQQDWNVHQDDLQYNRDKLALDQQFHDQDNALKLQMQQIDIAAQQATQGTFEQKAALEKEIQGTFAERQAADLRNTALRNPWVQRLTGMAPAWGAPGGPGPSGTPGAAAATGQPFVAQQLAANGGATATGANAGAPAWNPPGTPPGTAPTGWPSYQAYEAMDPFQRAAMRTQAEVAGTPWESVEDQMRQNWGAAGGPTTAPNTTALEAAKGNPLQQINKEQLAETFGQTPQQYWQQQQQTWQKAGAAQVAQTA